MIYTIIISLLIEKPFYLLRPQSFSFQIVSEFKDIFVGEGFCSFQVVSGGLSRGMVLDEIDTCIIGLNW